MAVWRFFFHYFRIYEDSGFGFGLVSLFVGCVVLISAALETRSRFIAGTIIAFQFMKTKGIR